MSPRNQQGKKSIQTKIKNKGIEGSGVTKRSKARKHPIRTPPSSPKSGKQSSSSQKSPVQSMGVDEKDSMPAEEAKDVRPLPYVEVKLPDGRLIRQCRASDACPLAESFIEKRARMENHLREKHGIDIKIPNRPVGRPTNEILKSRPCRTFPHPNAETWKRQAEKRSLDKDGKFERNRRTYERIQSLRAEEAWNELKDEFKTATKENYIASWVKDKMSKYMSTATERVAKIEKRMQARGKTKVFFYLFILTFISVMRWLFFVCVCVCMTFAR